MVAIALGLDDNETEFDAARLINEIERKKACISYQPQTQDLARSPIDSNTSSIENGSTRVRDPGPRINLLPAVEAGARFTEEDSRLGSFGIGPTETDRFFVRIRLAVVHRSRPRKAQRPTTLSQAVAYAETDYSAHHRKQGQRWPPREVVWDRHGDRLSARIPVGSLPQVTNGVGVVPDHGGHQA